MVRLGEVLTRSTETTAVLPDSQYQEITVKLWGKGVVQRGRVLGAELAAGRRYVARANQLIYSRIDARNGALGIVPLSLDGALLTNDFPVFDLRADRLLPEYVGWLVRTASFVERCQAASEGTTNRVRLQEPGFLAVEIPLPPIEGQRQLVARFDALATAAAEARTLRVESLETAQGILRGEELRIWPAEMLAGAPHLADVTTYLARGRQAEQGDSEHLLIKTQHVQQGRYLPTTLRLAPQAAARVHTDAIARTGDVLVACSAAGCLGRVARFSEHGLPASVDTHVAIARPDPAIVEPEYLYAYLRGAQGQLQLRSRERGDWQREKVGFRLTELNLNDLRAVPVPVPPRAEQRRIVERLSALHRAMSALLDTLAEAKAYTEALVPALLQRALAG